MYVDVAALTKKTSSRGAIWMVLINVATHPIRPVLYFYDQEGHPIDPESVVDLTGDLEVTEDGALSVTTAIEPLGELTISTHDRGELVSGSVRCTAPGLFTGIVVEFDAGNRIFTTLPVVPGQGNDMQHVGLGDQVVSLVPGQMKRPSEMRSPFPTKRI